jgi:hypothetical protein
MDDRRQHPKTPWQRGRELVRDVEVNIAERITIWRQNSDDAVPATIERQCRTAGDPRGVSWFQMGGEQLPPVSSIRERSREF